MLFSIYIQFLVILLVYLALRFDQVFDSTDLFFFPLVFHCVWQVRPAHYLKTYTVTGFCSSTFAHLYTATIYTI